MNPLLAKAFEREAGIRMVKATEQWAKGYEKSPETLGKLIKTAARLERKLLLFFRDLAGRTDTFFSPSAYNSAVYEVKASRIDAYDVNVIVNDDIINDNLETPFITVVFEDIALSTALGAQAGEITYSIPLGLAQSDAAIQKLVNNQVAELIGKKIDKDGKLIDNPKAKYRISDKTRADIKSSIQTSINLGEDVQAATKRLQSVIRNPRRAALIAHQETVQSYASGLHHFGEISGAIGKQWTDNGAVDICRINTLVGPIRYDQAYPSGAQHPTAHIGCKCYERLIYQNELDANPRLFG